jgi:microcystin-dependent protein
MSEPYLAEIRIFSFNFAPKGWAQCNGQLLPINQNQALFSLLGTMYGGNGQTNFQLPNLQGRCAMHTNGSHPQGQSAGEQSVTLTTSQIPSHTHNAIANNSGTNQASPACGSWSPGSADQVYSTAGGANMSPSAIANAGQSQPHNNLMPYLTLTFCIALLGIFPSRN